MKKSNNIIYFVILLIILLFILYINLQTINIEEPFVGYLNSKRREVLRNLRYRTQYAKQNFNNYIRRFKKKLF